MSNLTPIVLSLVQTVQSALIQGDDRTLKRLNLSRKDAESLVALNAAEMAHIANTQVFNFFIDRTRLPDVIRRARRKTAESQLIDQLILAGANHTFISRFFALTTHDMAARRKVLGIECPGGRSRQPDDETVKQVYAYWHQHKPNTTDPITLASAALNTAQALKVAFSDVVYTIEKDLPPTLNNTVRLAS